MIVCRDGTGEKVGNKTQDALETDEYGSPGTVEWMRNLLGISKGNKEGQEQQG